MERVESIEKYSSIDVSPLSSFFSSSSVSLPSSSVDVGDYGRSTFFGQVSVFLSGLYGATRTEGGVLLPVSQTVRPSSVST